MKIKICGITNRDDALAAVDAGADALGFVFAEEGKKRNRFIEPDTAAKIVEALPPFVTTVGVVVNESMAKLAQLLSIVERGQLHGDEQPGDIPVEHLTIKSFRPTPTSTVSDLWSFAARAWLIDAHVPGDYGGTGELADWDFAKDAVATGRPVILAGGLTPDNVAEAVRAVKPYAVDTSSGVESEPGKKDHERIRRFIDHAREASLS